jgi:predicted transcriptional regulator
MVDIRNAVRQKYEGQTFTVEQFAAALNVMMACAYRQISRLLKMGWLRFEKV